METRIQNGLGSGVRVLLLIYFTLLPYFFYFFIFIFVLDSSPAYRIKSVASINVKVAASNDAVSGAFFTDLAPDSKITSQCTSCS